MGGVRGEWFACGERDLIQRRSEPLQQRLTQQLELLASELNLKLLRRNAQ